MRVLSLLLVLCIAAWLAGCSAGGGSGAPGGPGDGGATDAVTLIGAGVSGTPVSDVQRSTALTALDTVAAPLLDGGVANLPTVAATLAARPEFEAAGYSANGGYAWGRFTDGHLAIMVANRPTDKRLPLYTPAPRSRAAASELPKTSKYSIHDGMGTAFSHPGTHVSSYMNFAGYSAGGYGATVENYKQIQNAGVVYIDAHGGEGVNRLGAPIFGIWTNTPYTAENEQLYGDDLDYSRLVYMYANNDKDANDKAVPEWHYAITQLFVQSYMSFDKDSVVFVNACSSYSQYIREMFLAKGAGVYIGWTKPVYDSDAYNAALFFFDRMTASNTFEKEDPNQRPFDLASVWADLRQQGYDTGGAAGAGGGSTQLLYALGSGSTFGLLRPTISYMDVDESQHKLTIHGSFGAKEGTVTIGNDPLTVQQWGADTIECNLPPEKAGYVSVKVGDIRSNEAPLTEWTITVRFRQVNTHTFTKPEDVNQNMDYTLRFRADVHGYREQSGGEVTKPRQVPFTIEENSTASYSKSGVVTFQDTQYVKSMTTYTGNGTITNVITEAPSSFYQYMDVEHLAGFGYFDVEAMNVVLCIDSIGKTNCKEVMEDWIYVAPGYYEKNTVDGEILAYTEGDLEPAEMYHGGVGLSIPLDQQFTIQGNSRTTTRVLNDKNTEKITISWDTSTPKCPPAQDDHRVSKKTGK